MCRLGEMKHLAAGQTVPSFRAFSPAESLMRVHSVGTGLHNLRLREIEGCAQIFVYALCCINRLLFVRRGGSWAGGGGGGGDSVTLSACPELGCSAHTQWVTAVCVAGHINQAGM